VCRRRVAFLQYLIGEHDAVVGSQLHRDSRRPLERGGERLRQLEVLAVVDGERALAAAPTAREQRDNGAREHDECASSHHSGYTIPGPATRTPSRSPISAAASSKVRARSATVSEPSTSSSWSTVSAP